MDFLDRYFEVFEGQPDWVLWVVSIFLILMFISIMGKLLKFSVWLFVFIIVIIFAVGGLNFFWGS
ncbi:MAG: hypothetical protein WD490_01420 [Opitutales bacterium]